MLRWCVGASGLALVLACGLCGGLVGLLLGLWTDWFPPWSTEARTPRAYPLPHHLPKHPGGVSFRFAMVHDVLHERFPRHGPAYYRERNRRTRLRLAHLERRQPEGSRAAGYFDLLDDLGAGLDALGRHDEAVEVLRDKLRQQQAQGLDGRDLYTSYANLGTFLIHGSLRLAPTQGGEARARMREGLGLVRRSIEVKPSAHFGREVWQAVVAEFLLAALDRPALLLRFDMLGNRLDRAVDPSQADSFRRREYGHGLHLMAAYALEHEGLGGPEEVRELITRVGAEPGWADAVTGSHREAVPFDEPVLGIVGMWRGGGGASPHFALVLGETMLRVGQRYIAWCAYERAALLAGRFSPDKELQSKLTAHCRARQKLLEEGLPPQDVRELRPRFEAELAHGRRFQQEYQDHEARRIAAGAAPEDPHFYDAFFRGRPPIASPPGPADQFLVEPSFRMPNPNWGAAVFVAGLFAFLAACWQRCRAAGGPPCGAAPP
jgi:hypothetical protein